MNGWPASAIEKLQSGHDIFNITNAEGTDLTLYAEIGHFVAPIPGGLLADYIGRKPMFTIATAGSLIGWTLLTFGRNFTYYAVARIILGFNFGIHCVLMSIYIAEISSQHIRGAFSSTSMFSFNVGILLQFVLGNLLSLPATNAFTFGLCVLQMLNCFFLKESPYFLVASNQEERAKRCLLWLRGCSSDTFLKEFATIKERVEARQRLLTSVKSLFSSSNYKGFVLCMIASCLADLSGRVTIITFATHTFKKATDPSTAHLMTVLVGICNVLFPIIPMLWLDKVGRKTIIIVSSMAIVFMHSASGFVLLLTHKYQWLQWALFASLTGYLGATSVCVTSIFTLRGEILSENCRGLASGFSSMAIAFGVFASTKCFQLVTAQLGLPYAFWLLAAFSAPLIFFTWIFIPETKNKNFEEIQMDLYSVKVQEAEIIECTKM